MDYYYWWNKCCWSSYIYVVPTKCSTTQQNEFILTRIPQKSMQISINLQHWSIECHYYQSLPNCYSVFHGTQLTCSLSVSPQLTTLSLYVYPAGTWFFAFLGREQIGTSGVKKMYSFQHTSRSAFPCVPAPTGQGVLYPLHGILHRSLL